MYRPSKVLRFEMLLSEQEHEKFRQAAKAAGISMAEYLRRSAADRAALAGISESDESKNPPRAA